MCVEGVIKVVAASCVIHNIREMWNEPFFDEWLQERFQAPHVAAFAGPSAEAGADIRDTLAAYFLTPEGQSTGNWWFIAFVFVIYTPGPSCSKLG